MFSAENIQQRPLLFWSVIFWSFSRVEKCGVDSIDLFPVRRKLSAVGLGKCVLRGPELSIRRTAGSQVFQHLR